jgi:FlaA1/EpsC-like NDP-sugar epimerase
MATKIALDVGAWMLGLLIATYLRLELHLPADDRIELAQMLVLAGLLQILTGIAVGIYRGRWRYGSFDEVAGLALVAVLNATGLYLLSTIYFDTIAVPRSAIILGAVIGLVLMAAIRYLWRLMIERGLRPSGESVERLLVYGAGDLGVHAVTGLLADRTTPYLPVGFIDDNPAVRRLSVKGISVMGGRESIGVAARRTDAVALLVAQPEIDAETMGDVVDRANEAGLAVKVLPPIGDMLGDEIHPGDVRDLTEADLLGRHQIETDVHEIASYVRGRRVLVTGAGGSIGSELCRQLHRFGPAELMMLDRDESALHQVQLSISGRALLDSPDLLLADIRDAERIHQLFLLRRPEVVFHAAALKHLPLLEQHPEEAFKSNILGTQNVLDAAAAAGVDVFVNISTDKAANPTSVLGMSKRVAEQLTSHQGRVAEGAYLSVRFGNVLGSRGSVLVSFHEQIARGGPVTVTDRDVTRFFMTVSEAVQLVIQAGAIGRSGEVLVLDMGEPVHIYEVARRLIAQSGKPIDIVFTGLRPGEKLHEELFGDDEADYRPRHKLISHALVPALDPAAVPDLRRAEPMRVRAWMASAC